MTNVRWTCDDRLLVSTGDLDTAVLIWDRLVVSEVDEPGKNLVFTSLAIVETKYLVSSEQSTPRVEDVRWVRRTLAQESKYTRVYLLMLVFLNIFFFIVGKGNIYAIFYPDFLSFMVAFHLSALRATPRFD